MNVKPDPKVLEDASRWHARLLAADCTPEEHAAFSLWRKVPEHARAYALAVKLDALLARSPQHPKLQALAAQALREETPAAPVVRVSEPNRVDTVSRDRRRWVVPASLAAGLALLMIAIGNRTEDPSSAAPLLSSYQTAPDERQTFTLDDGTTVHADIATHLTVSMGESGREIELKSGRALFSVARDPERPFRVRAGSTQTVALGTQFQVEQRHEAIFITLAEGSVRITGGLQDTVWEQTLAPGEQISLDSPVSVPQRLAIDPNQVTSWSRGRLLFRGTPLQEAIEEINRYAPTKVRLADPALADLKVGGNFIAGDSRPIVSAFAAVLPLTIVERDGELLLFRRNDTGG